MDGLTPAQGAFPVPPHPVSLQVLVARLKGRGNLPIFHPHCRQVDHSISPALLHQPRAFLPHILFFTGQPDLSLQGTKQCFAKNTPMTPHYPQNDDQGPSWSALYLPLFLVFFSTHKLLQFMNADSLLFPNCAVLSLAASSTWKASLSPLALYLRLIHSSGFSGNTTAYRKASLNPWCLAWCTFYMATWHPRLTSGIVLPQVQHLSAHSETWRAGAVFFPCFISSSCLAYKKVLTKCWNWTKSMEELHCNLRFPIHIIELEPSWFIESTRWTKKYKRKVRHLLFKNSFNHRLVLCTPTPQPHPNRSAFQDSD